MTNPGDKVKAMLSKRELNYIKRCAKENIQPHEHLWNRLINLNIVADRSNTPVELLIILKNKNYGN